MIETKTQGFPWSLPGESITATLFQTLDWSNHPLGPSEAWPVALKVSLNTLFHSRHPMFIWWGPELYQFYNDGYLPSFGVGKHPRAMGQRGEECWPEIWPIIKPQIDLVMLEAGSTWNENQLVPIYRNGQIEDVYWTYGYSPIFNEDGQVGGVLVVCTETTGAVEYQQLIKQANRQAELERANLLSLFTQAPIPLAMLEGPDHRFRFANETYQRYFLKIPDFVGRKVDEIIPDVRAQGFIALLDEVYETGKRYVGNEIPFALTGADGLPTKLYLNFVYEALRDTDNQIEGILVVISDVTEQVRVRSELATEQQKLEAMIANSPAGIALTRGPDCVFEKANARYTALASPREYVGKTFSEVYPESSAASLVPIIKLVYETGEPYSALESKLGVVTQSGALEDRFYDYSYTRISDSEGKPYGVTIQAFDVTDRVLARKRVEESEERLRASHHIAERAKVEAERASEAKSAFLANMSHEIRTPLGAILGFTELMKESTSAEERASYADTIQRNGKSLTKIIDDILDLSKVEAGRLELERLVFDVTQLTLEVVDLFSDAALKKGIHLEVTIDPQTPSTIKSDPTRIRQILINLVGNAMKFTTSGTVSIHVEPEFSGHTIKCIQFSIHDTGLGLSEEQMAKLFEPFSQADNSTTRKFGGSGLGLALSKRLAQALGGDVRVANSKLGEGSTFLATVEAVATGQVLDSPPPPEASQPLTGLKILLVEDSVDNQILLELVLGKTGASVAVAQNGLEGVQKAMEHDFDIILMDMQMPVLDGYDATIRLRRGGYRKPIIALTAHAMAEEVQRTRDSGCSAHLTKPLDFGLLTTTISQLIEGRPLL